MREGWEKKKLGEIASVEYGFTAKSTLNGTLRYIRITDINKDGHLILNAKKYIDDNENAKKFKLFENDILMARTGATFGKVLLYKDYEPSVFASYLIRINFTINMNNKLYWYFSHSQFYWSQANSLSSGSAQPHFNGKALKELFFKYPKSLEEQTQIVNTLDKAFKQIDQAKANLEKNLYNAKELFQSKLNEVFFQRGEGWEEKRLGEIATVEYGFTAKSTTEGTFRYIRITDIDKSGNLILDAKKYINDSEEAKKFQLKENDILMARTGATFGKVLLYKDYEPSVFASYLIRIHFTENISNELYWYFSKSQFYWSQANSLSSGSAQPHFNGKALKEVIFSYPKSVEEQEKLIIEFKSLLDEIENLQTHYQQKLNNLEELKKSILQKAFRGEL